MVPNSNVYEFIHPNVPKSSTEQADLTEMGILSDHNVVSIVQQILRDMEPKGVIIDVERRGRQRRLDPIPMEFDDPL